MKTEIELIPIPPIPLKSEIARTIRIAFRNGEFHRIKNNGELTVLKDGDFIHTMQVSYRVVIHPGYPDPTPSSNELFPLAKVKTMPADTYAEFNTFFTPATPTEKKYVSQGSLLPLEKKLNADPLLFLKKSSALSQNLQPTFPFFAKKSGDDHDQ